MMFKNIFVKLLATNLAIMISVIAVLSLSITKVYSWYVFNEKQKELEKTGHNVNMLINRFEKKDLSQGELNASLDSMGYITDSKIYIIRIDKKSLENQKSLKLGEDLEESFLINDLRRIMEGENVFREKQYSKEFDAYVVFEGLPWKKDNGISGAILLFSPISEISSNITKLNLVIWTTALVFIILSAVVIYINSSRISKPIKEMELAAVSLASGENTEDLVVMGDDEIGRLARAFNYMKQQLSNTEKMRREFIANVSHDLRTPLTSISGFVDGMLDGIVKPEDYNKYLNIIKSETQRLTRLTNEILQLAKIQSGSIKLFRENIMVREVLDSITSSTTASIEGKSISASVECDDKIIVNADQDKLKQMLINVIDNAVKYTGHGGKIFINVKDKSSCVEFSIKDTGIGIPDEELPFIFEKFYRVDKSRQPSRGGTGLGLNIVKSLVELHGGRIWAVSQLGTGTEIIFELPK